MNQYKQVEEAVPINSRLALFQIIRLPRNCKLITDAILSITTEVMHYATEALCNNSLPNTISPNNISPTFLHRKNCSQVSNCTQSTIQP